MRSGPISPMIPPCVSSQSSRVTTGGKPRAGVIRLASALPASWTAAWFTRFAASMPNDMATASNQRASCAIQDLISSASRSSGDRGLPSRSFARRLSSGCVLPSVIVRPSCRSARQPHFTPSCGNLWHAMPKVLSERRERTLIVSINRPEVRNCVDADTAQGLFDAVDAFRSDDSLDVLVLTGAGDVSFCSGADLKATAGLGSRPGARESGPMGFSRLTDVNKPTIAAVNGYCTAGGLELACSCDFRIAARNAQFGILNRRWGVPLLDGGTQRLPRIVGLGHALYLIQTGMLIDADQALRMGLVQEVVPEGQALPP